ncbi:hypothetical protein [Pseudoalteromonas sp. BDTF-M6]|uniref:hypothetical protein n=1 Tax=Pseudoalteromonas sp. BDTF-M6 TaxID=2796132 RepID=UPI001BB0D2FD|nr:hypothetical protein [Pseudoalteromonas sp. BDTF-M6]MBS3797912.1 hypothetical protein [Pseudoalteromonas sp. BDTF-M6]
MQKRVQKQNNTLLRICLFSCFTLSLSWLFISDQTLLLIITLLVILRLVWGLSQRLLTLMERQKQR